MVFFVSIQEPIEEKPQKRMLRLWNSHEIWIIISSSEVSLHRVLYLISFAVSLYRTTFWKPLQFLSTLLFVLVVALEEEIVVLVLRTVFHWFEMLCLF